MAEVLLAWIQSWLNPLWVVGRIGILLALQAYAYVLRIGDATLAGNILIGTYALEVTAVNLNTRLVGKHLHEDTGLGAVKACANLSVVALTILIGIQAEVVVVASSVLNLVEAALDAVAPCLAYAFSCMYSGGVILTNIVFNMQN